MMLILLLGFSKLLHGSSIQLEQGVLGEGQVCGGALETRCDVNLSCVVTRRSAIGETPPGTGVCSPTPAPGCGPCPPARRVCPGAHVTDPCGCCLHCARQRAQLCGGSQWEMGYCDRGLTCTLVLGLDPAFPPHSGVCKVLPGHQADPLADPLCPWVWGCSVRAGSCDCYTLQTCHFAHSFYSLDQCLRTLRGDEQMGGEMTEEDVEEKKCVEWGCEVQGEQCVCLERSCSSHTPLLSEEACKELLEKARCGNVSCPEIPVPTCPSDSFLTEPYTPTGHCCSLLPAKCTCDLERCPLVPPTCPLGHHTQQRKRGNGHPGSCCDQNLCLKI